MGVIYNTQNKARIFFGVRPLPFTFVEPYIQCIVQKLNCFHQRGSWQIIDMQEIK